MRCKTPYIQIFWFSKFIKPQETFQWWNQQTLFALPLRLIFASSERVKICFFTAAEWLNVWLNPRNGSRLVFVKR